MSKALLILNTLFLLSNSKFLKQFSPEMNIFLQQNNFIAADSSNSSNSTSDKKNSLINVKCFWVNKSNVYQLFGLQKKKEDYTYTNENQKSKIIYNFCQDIVTQVNNEKIQSSMVYVNEAEDSYKRLTGTFNSKSGQTPKNTWSVYNKTVENKTVNVLKIQFEEGDQFENGEKYKTTLHLECNKKVNLDLNFTSFDINKRVNEIYGKSKYACPINHYYILEFLMNQSPIVTCIAACVFGVFLLFLGAKAVKITVVIVTTLAVVIVGSMFIFQIFTIETETSVFIILGILTLAGIIVGCILIKAVKIFIIILGVSLGFTVSTFVYDAILPLIDFDAKMFYYITVIGCCILFALIALCVVKHVLIFGTSIIGGYLVIRGISFVVGNYPNESQLFDLIKHEEWEQFEQISNKYVYLYLGGWILLSIIGIIVQYNHYSDDKEEKKYKKMNN